MRGDPQFCCVQTLLAVCTGGNWECKMISGNDIYVRKYCGYLMLSESVPVMVDVNFSYMFMYLLEATNYLCLWYMYL